MADIDDIGIIIQEIQQSIKSDELSRIDKLDIYALEEEWKEQPHNYRIWSEKLADSKKLVNSLDQKIKIRKAKVDKDVRRQPSRYNLEKATNEAVNNVVELDPDYRKLSEIRIEAQYLVDVLFGVIISLEHKRDALKEERKLFLNNYYTEPYDDDREGRQRQNRNERLKERRSIRDK